MAFHQIVQHLILIGVDLGTAVPVTPVAAPERLQPLIDAIDPPHRAFDEEAIRYGHRYRSGFWAIYLLSAVAVLCAMMPLALGWDSEENFMHPFTVAWVVAEIAIIGAVAILYWRGHRMDWQGQWLRARTLAEFTAYLPLIAPLVDYSRVDSSPDWYQRAMPADFAAITDPAILTLCATHEALARQLLTEHATDAGFIRAYGAWVISILLAQRQYHAHIQIRYRALRHRIHRITACLFMLTALAALAHLFIHSRWLSLMTTFFPALAAALHGALAQSEAYRMENSAKAVAMALSDTIQQIDVALHDADEPARLERLRAAITSALSVILQEHQEWQMLVRPHHLPLG
jgi:hypothetical protein